MTAPALTSHNKRVQNGPHIFSVKEVTRYIRTTLERERALQGLLVRGEVSNCRYHTSGHLYFTLKDDASALPCVMWRDRVMAQTFRLSDGMKVIAEGTITVYEKGGNYQLQAYSLQAEGVGNLYLAFEQLKRKLEAEGLFAEERKRPIPALPRCIALCTSPTGAVAHDFLTVSTRRWRGRHIVLVPTVVQGDMAPASITRSLTLAARAPEVDVIVLARGGGSLEDLSCFNSEAVARAIAASPVPVVSAVGHETDYTIADFVADLRAPTPSAAAELVAPDMQGVELVLQRMQRRILDRVSAQIEHGRRDLQRVLTARELRDPLMLVHERTQRVDQLSDRILERSRLRTMTAAQQLKAIEARVAALDPRGVLLRGYALVLRSDDSSLIPSAAEARKEAQMDVQFFDDIIRVNREE